MNAFRTFVIALGIALWLPITGQAAEDSVPSAEDPTPPAAYTTASEKCLKAVVSLYSFCTNPHDAAVELPLPPASFQHPCTVHGRISGCGN